MVKNTGHLYNILPCPLTSSFTVLASEEGTLRHSKLGLGNQHTEQITEYLYRMHQSWVSGHKVTFTELCIAMFKMHSLT